MNLFDSLKDIITNGVELPTELPVVGDIQEHITNATDGLAGAAEGLTEKANGALDQGQTVVEDITNRLGL